ncbi:tail fiber protein [Pectobacterium odoriferum]|uniref:tail fiber protein n=1 Tax=Pectobacterium odoriferum TaxID=78398 RepID=UPI001FCAE56A|nr:tail fiber protein [Pectobacterium odoriferum]
MTIERGQEGTAARIWSANDIAANMMTAGTLSYLKGDIDGKLAKDQNGADIPNKPLFRENAGITALLNEKANSNSVLLLKGPIGTADLDTLGGPSYQGRWTQGATANATIARHYPIVSAGSLDVIYNAVAGYGTVQIYTTHISNRIFIRSKPLTADPWSNWVEVWTSGNLPNPATLDTAQTFLAMQLFKSNQTPVRILAPNPGDPVFIPFYDSNGASRKGWLGRGSTNIDTIELVNDVAASGLVLLHTGVVRLTPGTGANAVVRRNGVDHQIWDAGNLQNPLNGDVLAGIPLPFPAAVAPSGWLKCNGQSFDKTLYPVLASRYPSGILPDLRGEFVRGWDDGRGVDTGRALLSAQSDAIRNITGRFNPGGNGVSADSELFTAGPWGQASNGGAAGDSALITFDASKVVPTANENRPRNIAFNYIVRAA